MAAVAVTAVASGAGVAVTAVDDAEAIATDNLTVAAPAPRNSESGVSRDAARSVLEDRERAFDRPGAQRGADGLVPPGDRIAVQASIGPREVARSMLPEYGWDGVQYSCLDQLWISESNWDHTATNPTSGAYGIPQALPAEKMASAGPDWRTNPATQIEWGLEYIRLSYGTPCSANSFKLANNWY